MANRKTTVTIVVESNAETHADTKQLDYDSDKALVLERYGPGAEFEGQCTYELDDINGVITLTRVDTEFVPQ